MSSFLEWYSYENMGVAVSGLLFVFFAFVLFYRLGKAFINYVYTGTFGDHERSMFGQIMEGKGLVSAAKYAILGYHPFMAIFDGMVFVVIALMASILWGAYIIVALIVLLAMVMRKRIAHKQKFVANLRGQHQNG